MKHFRYDILYSQAVTSEDIFLQMGNKTPATSSCENMTVSVVLFVNKHKNIVNYHEYITISAVVFINKPKNMQITMEI